MDAVAQLRHYAGKATELSRLRERIADLEELLGLKDAIPLRIIGVQPKTLQMIGVLLRREFVSRDMAMTALYPNEEERTRNNIEVRICYARRFCRQHDVNIVTVHGSGWYIPAGDKVKLRAAIEACRQ